MAERKVTSGKSSVGSELLSRVGYVDLLRLTLIS